MTISLDDTIVAIATPPGQGGVGIVRLSGPQAWAIGQRLFTRHHAGKIRSHQLMYGQVIDPATGATLDDGLIAFMRAPHSYTGDDVAEINAHGSPFILGRIVEAALAQGARAAEPGEMTLRAFLHGRIDLAQAEAVADLIAANSDAAARQAMGQLEGHLSRQVQIARVVVMRVLAPIEASIDFPEEEVPTPDPAELAATLTTAQTVVTTLLADAERGRIAREGVRCVITGRPNVGKSSLLNYLLRADRAIVTPIAGTTRDTIEETALIGGVAFHLIDTAGITATDDPIERIGIARSRAAIESADIAIQVLDRSTPFTAMDAQIHSELNALGFGQPHRQLVMIANKCDLPPASEHDAWPQLTSATSVTTSLVTSEGLDALETALIAAALGGSGDDSAALVARARHRDALRSASDALFAAQATLHDGLPLDLVAEDLQDALHDLGLITGESVTEDLLSSIFSEFCIGK